MRLCCSLRCIVYARKQSSVAVAITTAAGCLLSLSFELLRFGCALGLALASWDHVPFGSGTVGATRVPLLWSA